MLRQSPRLHVSGPSEGRRSLPGEDPFAASPLRLLWWCALIASGALSTASLHTQEASPPPRLKLEYQLSRAIFFRFVGEYDAYRQDDLRDDSRTDLPVFLFDRESGEHERALGYTSNQFRADWLFSYQPVPGTVVFAGYGSTMAEERALRFQNLARARNGFFVKLSYLFRP